MDSFGVQTPATIMKPRNYRLSNNDRRGIADASAAASNDNKLQPSRRLDPNPRTNEFDLKFETVIILSFLLVLFCKFMCLNLL